MTKPRYRRLADGSTTLISDGFQNVVANLGTARDKAAGAAYGLRVYSPAELLAAYRTAWLPRKIVDIIPMDATRRWRAWQADKNQISALEAEENRLGLRIKLREAQTAARLFGGAVIYIGTGESDVSTPLSPQRIGKGGLRHLTVIGRDHITPGEIDQNPESDGFGKPGSYRIHGSKPVDIHPSRLVILKGAVSPAGSPQTDHWGDSVLQPIFEAITQADGTAANVASLVYEAKVDVIHMPRLMEMLQAEGGEEKVSRYLMSVAMMKGNNGMLVLDGGDTSKPEGSAGGTTYDSKSATFGGLADIWDRMMQIVSGAADIPMTRLFGMSPKGMNATGEHDAQNYASRIKAMQELELTPAMTILDECLIRSALGARPDEVFYDWRALNEPTDKERAEVGKLTAEVIEIMNRTGLWLPEVMAEAGANAMIETGAVPGLEAAVDEHGLEIEEPDEDEAAAALGTRETPATVGDAAPRTLYVSRKLLNADDLIAWAKGQGFNTTLAADDLHVTIAYSRTPLDWMEVGESWQSTIEVAEGGPRLMEQFGEARVLLFKAAELEWRHEAIKEAGASWDHPEYQPHITISYDPDAPELEDVQPYQGKIVLGPEIFAEVDENWSAKAKEA